ncbi:MAG: ABC transporter permease subunit [Candidatus Thorarchaeota archaeon]
MGVIGRYVEFRFNLSPKSRSYIYVSLGLILASLILVGGYSNLTMGYNVYGGYVYRFGWDDNEKNYQVLNWGKFPQGVVGQQIEVLNRFTAETDPGFGIHVLLLNGKEDQPLLQDENRNWRTDITLENLAPHAHHLLNLTYDEQLSQRRTTHLSIPMDDAYIVIYLADAFSIAQNLTGTLIVDEYGIIGQDNGIMWLGTGLLTLALVLGIGITLLPTIKASISKNQPPRSIINGSNASTLVSVLEGMNSSTKDSDSKESVPYGRLPPIRIKNFLILFKFELFQVFGSPFVILFIPLTVTIILERFREVYTAWEPSGGYVFGEFGTTIGNIGVSFYIIVLSIILTITLLFLCRDFDEGVHKVRLALPLSRKGYILGKLSVLILVSFLICVAFVGGTFVLVPLRNPTIGFQPIDLLWIPFFAYGIVSFTLSCLSLLLALILKNSRYTVISWLGFIASWFFVSADLESRFFPYTQEFLDLPHAQETFDSYLSIFVPERVIEYFFIRPIAPDWILEDKLLFLHDAILDLGISIGFHFLLALGCIIVGSIVFMRRDL